MSNKTVKAPQMSNVELTQQVETLTQEKQNALAVANLAATQLIYIENRFSPLLSKKFNVWNALFHIQEVVLLVKEIIAMIQDFKARYVNKNTDGPTQ